MGRIVNDALDRTDSQALGVRVMTDTFGTESGVDLIDLLSLRNRTVRAFRFTHVTIDAFIRN